MEKEGWDSGEYLRLELCSRYKLFRNVSLRVVGAGASRRLLGGGEAIAETLFSRSDSAKSCLMISPFSDFSALLGSSAYVFANIANTARAVAAPIMKMNTILITCAAFLACGQSSGSRQKLCTGWSCRT